MTKVTLSFDNGPTPVHTDAVVDLLDRLDVKASFFVVGEEIDKVGEEAAQIMRRTHAAGHWICNHTYSHGPPLGVVADNDRAVAEIERAQDRIGELAHPAKYFRPNGAGRLGNHLLSPAAADHLCAEKYTVVTWNNVPEDWTDPREQWVDRALANMDQMDWSLIVLHDFLTGPMLPTLERFIEQGREVGATFVQEFPPACIHTDRGTPLASLADVTGY